MNKGEDYANRHAIDLARVEAGSIVQVRSYLEALEREIVGKIEQSNIKAGEAAKLNRILTETRAAITSTYSEIKKVARADMRGVAELSSMAAGRIVNADIGADVFGSVLTENQISALLKNHNVFGASASAWWNGQEKALQDKFLHQMRMGYSLGEDVDTLARRVRGTKDAAGIMSVSKREADALVRSSVQTISNAARIEGFKQLPGVVKGIQWIATLDSRTTPICKALDRKVWSLPDLKPQGHNKVFPGPTAHWNCRSTQIPWLRKFDELFGQRIEQLGDKTLQEAVEAKLREKGWSEERIAKYRANSRASMDGQVSENLDYDGWLRGKSDQFVLKTLGKQRGRMFLDGQITVSDLTDQSNRPLTVDELKRAIATGKRPPETEGVALRIKAPKATTAPQRTAVDRAAKNKIAEVAKSADPSDRQLKLSLSEVQAAEPSLTPAQTLAKAEERTRAAIKAESDADTLATARQRLIDGGKLSARQAEVVDKLPEVGKADFAATVEAGKSARVADDVKAAVDMFDPTGRPIGKPAAVRSALDRLPPEYRSTVIDAMEGRAATASADDIVTAWRADPVKSKAIALVPSQNLSSAALIREATVELPAVIASELAPRAAGKTIENAVIKELTGLDAPAEITLRRWIESNALDAVVFLALAEGLIDARREREKAAEALSGAKAALVEGRDLNRAQRAAVDGLTAGERALFDEAVEDAKARGK